MKNWINIEKEKISIYVDEETNTYELHREVDFKIYPYKNYKNILKIKTKNSKEVLKIFANNEVEELKNRTRNILNERIKIYEGISKEDSIYARNKIWLEKTKAITGIKRIEENEYEVVEIYDEIENFKKENKEEDCIYGIFDIKYNEIEDIYEIPIQVLLCYDDFGKKELSVGSVFLKLKKVKIQF